MQIGLSWRLWLLLWAVGFLGLVSNAQAFDLARFPPVERVLTDFSDEAEQVVAFDVLSKAAQQAGPSGQALFGTYYNALNDIDFRLRNGDGATYSEFSQRVQERIRSESFRGGVLARYGLGGPAPAPPDESDEIQRALEASAPYWIRALLVVLLASPLLVLLLDRRRLPSRASGRDTLPAELRTVHVLGRSYEVEACSGTVVEKQSHTEQRVHVQTSGGGASVIGDQVVTTPTQVHVQTETTRMDCLWVRDADGNESAWNFQNAALQVRAGHAVSALVRSTPEGTADFLLAFNHATGQLDRFGGLTRAHQPRRLGAWVATTLLGAAMVLLALRAFVAPGGDVPLGALFQPSNWAGPLALAAVVAGITVPVSAAFLRNLRTRAFFARHAPAVRAHWAARAGR
jgi:hypothetical protein